MFDRYIRNSYGGPSTIKVQEHRAPTPDQAKYLRELEESARDRVLDVFHTTADNPFQGSFVMLRSDYTDQIEVEGRFTLNGEPYHVRTSIPEQQYRLDKRQFLDTLHELMVKVIAHELVFNHKNWKDVTL